MSYEQSFEASRAHPLDRARWSERLREEDGRLGREKR